jgi:Fur family ferric uptake transcriptional regulator
MIAENPRGEPCCSELADLEVRVRRTARKMTKARLAVLDILRRQSHPISAQEVFQALPSRDCDLATVYRSVRMLETMGLAKRFDLGDGVARFELLAEGDDGHHHHLVCTQCAAVVEVEECFPDDLEQRIAEKNGFKAIAHRLEFFGICPACQRC